MVNLVASGKRLIYAHPHSTDKKIGGGELVMIDVATTYNYYNSDMTRFVSLGRLKEDDKKKFEFIREVITELIDNSIEGNTIGDLWNKVALLYEKHGYSEYLNHFPGRGIGIELVEEPVIIPANSGIVLREDMVLAFNPSLGIPEIGGWRLEDVIVVGKKKAEILTQMPWDVVEK